MASSRPPRLIHAFRRLSSRRACPPGVTLRILADPQHARALGGAPASAFALRQIAIWLLRGQTARRRDFRRADAALSLQQRLRKAAAVHAAVFRSGRTRAFLASGSRTASSSSMSARMSAATRCSWPRWPGGHGRVLAVEPQPDIFERLAYNIRQNPFGTVKALDCAVADKTGDVTLFVDMKNHGRIERQDRRPRPGTLGPGACQDACRPPAGRGFRARGCDQARCRRGGRPDPRAVPRAPRPRASGHRSSSSRTGPAGGRSTWWACWWRGATNWSSGPA